MTEADPTEDLASGAPDPDADAGPDQEADLLRARRDALFEPAQRELARSLKRVLREEQNVLLDRIRSRKRNDAPVPLCLDADARTRLAQSALPSLSLAQGAGAEFVSADPGAPALDADEVRPIVDRLVAEIADSVDARLVGSSADDQSDPTDLGEAVGAAFRDWKATRIDALAGDFVCEAFGAGALGRARAAKLKLSWRFDDGGQDCPDCDDNAMAGEVAAGDEFPTGHLHPPVHPGCRCYLYA